MNVVAIGRKNKLTGVSAPSSLSVATMETEVKGKLR